VFLFGGLVALMCLAAASMLIGGAGTKKLIRDLKRRSLWKVSGLYLVVSWLALQVVDVLSNNYGLPEWFPPLALALMVVGLPVALSIAFVQDSSRGAGSAGQRIGGVGSEGGGRLLSWQNVFVVGAIAFGLWGAVATGWLLIEGESVSSLWLSMGEGGATTAPAQERIERAVGRETIAVLPFENLSSAEEVGHFADGIQVDVLAELSRHAELSVISRRSVAQYALGTGDTRSIASDLGATLLLEGSVRRARDRVRVVVQLIDGKSDVQLWSGTYDREFTVEELLTTQTEIARQISDELQSELALPAQTG
jgi:TolB-like protein